MFMNHGWCGAERRRHGSFDAAKFVNVDARRFHTVCLNHAARGSARTGIPQNTIIEDTLAEIAWWTVTFPCLLGSSPIRIHRLGGIQ
jgi:hypothetical protein